MKKNLFNFLKNKILTYFLFTISLTNLFAQQSWEFGDRYKAYVGHGATPTPRLKAVMHPGLSINSLSFASKVGGVAFNSVAIPDASLMNQQIKVDYIPGNNDGSRLRLIAGSDTAYSSLPDWQLIPIIKFSSDSFNACVSLFGPQSDSSKYQIIYHSAFQNTLLGVRILQADMFLMDPFAHSKLPKFNGKTTLGKGEKMPDTSSYIAQMLQILQIENILSGGQFQSWIFTDDGVDITFSIKDKNIILEGYPYYYFWLRDTTNDSLIFILETEYDKVIKEHNSYVKSYNHFQRSDDLSKILACENQLNEIESKLLMYDKTLPSKAVTDSLKNKYYLFESLNPAVYTACMNVSHYSALFRYIKNSNRPSWNKLCKSIQEVTLPKVPTPTEFPKNQLRKYE